MSIFARRRPSPRTPTPTPTPAGPAGGRLSRTVGALRRYAGDELRRRRIGPQQIILLALVLAIGVIMRTHGGVAVKEAGDVTIGTVGVSLLYEFVLRPNHDEQLVSAIQDSLIKRAGDYGLAGIDRLKLPDVFAQLETGDELWWLETYCPSVDLGDVRDALRAALVKGASVKMLMVNPNAPAAGYRAEEIDAVRFQEDARNKKVSLERFQRNLPHELRERLVIQEYEDLPCAPIYVQVRADRPIEAWTSYFLTVETDIAAHLHWDRAAMVGGEMAPGLGLQAFHDYFAKKWELAENRSRAPGSAADLLGQDTLQELNTLHSKPFAADLLQIEIRGVTQRIHAVAADGRFFRKQDVETQNLLLRAAKEGASPADTTVRLVHSTSEGDISVQPAFWKRFNAKLQDGVRDGELGQVRRLFVLDAPDETVIDEWLRKQLRLHEDDPTLDCRIVTGSLYASMQEHRSFKPVIHDFGIYGSVAYIWPRGGYGKGLDQVDGYFQVGEPDVARFRSLFDDCWDEGDRADKWLT
jgi:hypothetical protein